MINRNSSQFYLALKSSKTNFLKAVDRNLMNIANLL